MAEEAYDRLKDMDLSLRIIDQNDANNVNLHVRLNDLERNILERLPPPGAGQAPQVRLTP